MIASASSIARLASRVLAAGLVAALGAAAALPSAAQVSEPVPPDEQVTVVMTELEPFVLDDDGDPDGFYVEIWEELAAELDVGFDVVWVDEFGDLLPAVAEGRADVAVAPLAPTAAREADFDFSSAVISSGPQLAYHERSATASSIFRVVIAPEVLGILLAAAVGLVVLAHAIWLVERNNAEDDGHFDKAYLPGVWDGFWWAVVTVTTVGYGDKSPTSHRGRAVALVGMLISLFLVGAFVSQVTSVLNERRNAPPVSGLSDTGDRPVGVVAGTSFAAYVEGQGAVVRAYPSQEDLFDAVDAGEIDLMVTNPYAVALSGPEHGVKPIGDVLYAEFETFGLAQDSPWREPLNAALADLQASGEVEAILDRWLPGD